VPPTGIVSGQLCGDDPVAIAGFLMIIIYNLIGVGLTVAAAALALLVFLVLGGDRFGLLVILFGLFAVALDLWYRGKHDRRWFAPSGGGSLFFLPLWGFAVAVSLLGVLMLIVPPRDRNGNPAQIAGQTTPRAKVPAPTAAAAVAPATTALAPGQPAAESGIGHPPGLRFPEMPAFGSVPNVFGDIEASTPLKVGQDVQAYWDNRWFDAEILSLHDDGRVRIRVTGWGDASDATVERSNLRQSTLGGNGRETRSPRTGVTP
jgi:hypothetical protein